jgi:calcium-dependent protein kinase
MTDRVDFDAPALRQVSPQARDLLRRLLRRDPTKRLSASEALSHPWLRDDVQAPALPLRSSVVQRLQRFATYGHLKQLVLRIIASEIEIDDGGGADAPGDDALRAARALFAELDVDGSGDVTSDELRRGLERLGYLVSIDELEKLMEAVDVDRSGSLELAELEAGMADWAALQGDARWTNWVEKAFARLDRNGDGFISMDELLEELQTCASRQGVVQGQERMVEVRRMLREADVDGDGRVSLEEFSALLLGPPADDSLAQYDPRIRPFFSVDEDLFRV